MTYQALYLIEPRPALVDRLRNQTEPALADVLLEPRLYRGTESDRSSWFEPQRLAQAKLLFLASLREYDPIHDDAGFSAVFGSAAIGVDLFDRWFVIRRLLVDDNLDALEEPLRAVINQVAPPGIPLVDEWLAGLRSQGSAPDSATNGRT